MNDLKATVQARLKQASWSIEPATGSPAIPAEFAHRYAWVPPEVTELLFSLDLAVAADEKLWLVTGGIILGTAGSAFAADEFERISLDASQGDEKELARIRAFWDTHLCIAMSVRSGYSYYALDEASLGVVAGHEPEFEEASPFADSFSSFVERLCV